MQKGVFVLLTDKDHRCLFGARRDGSKQYPPGVLELPGGTIEKDETLSLGLAREIKEETTLDSFPGLVIDENRLLPFAFYSTPEGITSYYYTYQLSDEEARQLNENIVGAGGFIDGEHTEFKWVGEPDLKNISRIGMLALHRDVLSVYHDARLGLISKEMNHGIDGDLYVLPVSGEIGQIWKDMEGLGADTAFLLTYPITETEKRLHKEKRVVHAY